MSDQLKCLSCGKEADWVRYTQFAGDHPFCDECARKEVDFLEENSYHFWKHRRPKLLEDYEFMMEVLEDEKRV